MSSDDQLLKTLLDVAPGLKNGNYTFVASGFWFIWDWIISFDQEVEHFWFKKWTVGTILYFSNRLLGLLLLLLHAQTTIRTLGPEGTHTICRPFIWVLLTFSAISSAIIQLVLTLRTYALWDCNKCILWSLMFVNFGGFFVQIGLIFSKADTVTAVFNALPAPYNGCLVIFHGWSWQRLIPGLVFEILIAGMMLIKFVQYMREGRSMRIAYVLFRDGFVEFTVVSVTTIFALLVEIFGQAGATLFTISFDLTGVVGIVCCARMLLNIRDVMSMSKPKDEFTNNPWSFHPSTFEAMYGTTDDSEGTGTSGSSGAPGTGNADADDKGKAPIRNWDATHIEQLQSGREQISLGSWEMETLARLPGPGRARRRAEEDGAPLEVELVGDGQARRTEVSWSPRPVPPVRRPPRLPASSRGAVGRRRWGEGTDSSVMVIK